MHMAWTIFGVQNFEIQYFWGFSEKLIFLGVLRNFGYFFGNYIIGLFGRSFLYIVGLFLIWGCLIFLIFYCVNCRCWVQAYVANLGMILSKRPITKALI